MLNKRTANSRGSSNLSPLMRKRKGGAVKIPFAHKVVTLTGGGDGGGTTINEEGP